MNKLKSKLLAHKVVLGVIGVFVMVSVVFAFTGQNLGTVIENQVVQGDFIGATPVDVVPSFGAFPGPDVFADVNIFGSLTTGSGKGFATTSDSSYTLTVSDLIRYTYFDFFNDAENGSTNVTWTTPATSTFNQLLPLLGSTRTWTFRNASTTGTGNFLLAAGTGVELKAVATSSVEMIPDQYMDLTCTRIEYRTLDNNDIVCAASQYNIPAL